jgi:hypothetical protein
MMHMLRTALIPAVIFLGIGIGVYAQNEAPLSEGWAPTEWGSDERASAVNRITPEMVLRHAGLIKTGRYAAL